MAKAIEAIVDPATRGDPMRPLKWTSKSLSKISDALFNRHTRHICSAQLAVYTTEDYIGVDGEEREWDEPTLNSMT